MVDLSHVTTFGGDRDYTASPFQFKLNFKLPETRKERILFKRDKFGQIEFSKAPDYPDYILLTSNKEFKILKLAQS